MVDPLAGFFQALFWRAGSVVQLQSWREALAAVLNKRGERARVYLLSSFTRSAFPSFPFFQEEMVEMPSAPETPLSGYTISGYYGHQIIWPYLGAFFSRQIPPISVGHINSDTNEKRTYI